MKSTILYTLLCLFITGSFLAQNDSSKRIQLLEGGIELYPEENSRFSISYGIGNNKTQYQIGFYYTNYIYPNDFFYYGDPLYITKLPTMITLPDSNNVFLGVERNKLRYANSYGIKLGVDWIHNLKNLTTKIIFGIDGLIGLKQITKYSNVSDFKFDTISTGFYNEIGLYRTELLNEQKLNENMLEFGLVPSLKISHSIASKLDFWIGLNFQFILNITASKSETLLSNNHLEYFESKDTKNSEFFGSYGASFGINYKF